MALRVTWLVTNIIKLPVLYNTFVWILYQSATNLCTYTGHTKSFSTCFCLYLINVHRSLFMSCTVLLIDSSQKRSIYLNSQSFWKSRVCIVAYEKHNKFHVFLQQIWVNLGAKWKRVNESLIYHHIIHFHQRYQPLYREYFLLLDCSLWCRWNNCCSVTDTTACCSAMLSMAIRNNLCAFEQKENTKQHATVTFRLTVYMCIYIYIYIHTPSSKGKR